MPIAKPEAAYAVDRHTTIGEVALNIRGLIRKANPVLAVILVLETAHLFFTSSPAAPEFALVSLGSMIAFTAWGRGGLGLPLIPIFAIQHLLTFGLPAVVGNDDVFSYAPQQVTRAGVETLIFLATLTLAWRLGQAGIRPHRPMAYVLKSYDTDGLSGVRKIGYPLITFSTLWLFMQNFGPTQFIADMIPGNFYPVVGTVTSAASASGFFLIGLLIGSGQEKVGSTLGYGLLLAMNCLIGASSFLLSGPSTVLGACMIGLFWGSGRVPWRLLGFVLAILVFLNLGKWTMREKYWRMNTDDPIPSFDITQMPGHYVEWSIASMDTVTGAQAKGPNRWGDSDDSSQEGQNLLVRLNNLGNLLFVIDAIDHRRAQPLEGATYSVIPPLLIPRFLWPDKPRSHEGQIILNVYFGRQDFNSTMGTYVAWGLLAEAYGNFGPVLGAVVLGTVLGLFCAWAEAATVNKPLLSTEGFVAFTILLGLLNSYEMVASVMVTSIFQGIIPVCLACIPFVRWEKVERP